MNKNILIILISLIILVGGVIFLFNQKPAYEKESLTIEEDLTSIELSVEEDQTLQDEGLSLPPQEDPLADNLQSVRSSDELDAIEADINETDLSGLDAELDSILNDLSGF